MQLAYYKTEPTNFGDELNAYMWKKILPEGFLDDDPSELFVGIGSIIGEVLFPAGSVKHVVGSGYGGYDAVPDLDNGFWNIVFVRGPSTANALGLPEETAVCDSAILLREIPDLPAPAEGVGVAFMPHFESMPRGDWRRVCERAGVTLIDPTDPPEKVLSQIRGAELLITEAMHGAIVADALRTPWIGVRPFYSTHHRKWNDWAGALKMEPELVQLCPSSLRECITFLSGLTKRGPVKFTRQKWPDGFALRPLNSALVSIASKQLKHLSKTRTGRLSDDKTIAEATERAVKLLNEFVSSRS